MSRLDSHEVQAVAEALAKADWTNYGNRPDDWDQLPGDEHAILVWSQMRAARVAVAAVRATV